jgi:uncharacterized membrane protein
LRRAGLPCHGKVHRFYSRASRPEAHVGFAILIAGLALFITLHVFVAQRAARARVIARIGKRTYKAAFSLVAILALALIVYGFARYRAAGLIDIWEPPHWTRYIATPLMWLAFVGVSAAYFQGRIKTALKHPMLVGVKLWAIAHLASNGDLGSIVLFGAILLWAGYDRATFRHRPAAEIPSLAAPAPGSAASNDVVAVLIGTIIFLAFGYVFHPLWIGTPVFGTPALGT